MTLTYLALSRTEGIVSLPTGDAKAEVLQRLCAGDAQIPAGRVSRGRVPILADRTAARLRRKDMCEDHGRAP